MFKVVSGEHAGREGLANRVEGGAIETDLFADENGNFQKKAAIHYTDVRFYQKQVKNESYGEDCGVLVNSKSGAVEKLKSAIARHERHLSGDEPTDEKSQDKLMEEMEAALQELVANQRCEACGQGDASHAVPGKLSGDSATAVGNANPAPVDLPVIVSEILPSVPVGNAGKGQPRCGDSGHYQAHGSGTGKGEPHAAAKSGSKGLKQDDEVDRSPMTLFLNEEGDLALHVVDDSGLCLNCGGKGGKPGPCPGQKGTKGKAAAPAAKKPSIVAVPSTLVKVQAKVDAAKKKVAGARAELKKAQTDLATVKASMKSKVTSKSKTAKPKASVDDVVKKLKDFETVGTKDKSVTLEVATKRIKEMLGKADPHEVLKALGLKRKSKNRKEAESRIVSRVLAVQAAVERSTA